MSNIFEEALVIPLIVMAIVVSFFLILTIVQIIKDPDYNDKIKKMDCPTLDKYVLGEEHFGEWYTLGNYLQTIKDQYLGKCLK